MEIGRFAKKIVPFQTDAPVHHLSIEVDPWNEGVGDTQALIADVALH